MLDRYYQKTDKGREEIASRKYGLSLRTRSVLLLIDGKRRADELLRAYPGLGLTEKLLSDLLEQDFIEPFPPKENERPDVPVTGTSATGAPTGEAFPETIVDLDAMFEGFPPPPASDQTEAEITDSAMEIEVPTLVSAVEAFSLDGGMTVEDTPPSRLSRHAPLEEPATLFDTIKSFYLSGLRDLPAAVAAPLLKSLSNARTTKSLCDIRTAYLNAIETARGRERATQREKELDLLLFACAA